MRLSVPKSLVSAALVGMAILCTSVLASAQEATFQVEDVQAGLHQWMDQLKGVEVELSYTTRSGHIDQVDQWGEAPPLLEHEVSAFMRGSLIRFSRAAVAPSGERSPEEHVAWDGSRAMEMSQNAEDPKMLQGSISGTRGALLQAGYWQTLFGVRVFDSELSLANLFSSTKCTTLGAKKIGDRVVWGIECALDRSYRYQVWVDPDRAFLPLEIEQITADARGQTVGHIRLFDIVARQVDGVWLGSSAKLTVQNLIVAPEQIDVYRINARKVSGGLTLPDETFVLEYPEGTRVWDGTRDTSYIVGVGALLKDRKGLTTLVKGADPGSGKVTPVAAIPTTADNEPSGYFRWLLGGSLIAAGLLVAGRLILRRRPGHV